MTAVVAAPDASWAGRTTVQARALRRIAAAAVAELAGVVPGDVSVELTGARGALAVAVATPLDPASALAVGTLVERAVSIGDGLTRRLQELADRNVGRVDVRFTRLAGQNRERRVQ